MNLSEDLTARYSQWVNGWPSSEFRNELMVDLWNALRASQQRTAELEAELAARTRGYGRVT